MSDALVEAVALARRFGARVAVDGIDLALGPGDSLALFGPNGAGKTTLLRLLAGLLKPSDGAARVRGVDVRRDASARAPVGLISHHSMLYAPLTVFENVVFSARLHGLADAGGATRVALERMGVADRASAAVRTLSRGLQQRVSIARAIVHDPSVLLLDEPYSGLDDAGARALTGVLETLKGQGAALVLVTHNVAEGLALASHAAIMIAGRFARFDRHSGASGRSDAATYAAEYRRLVRDAGAVHG